MLSEIQLSTGTKLPANAVLAYGAMQRPDLWAMAYRQLSGRPYGFEALDASGRLDLRTGMMRFQRPFLQAPLADTHALKTYRKSRQCGMTENETSEVLWALDMLPYIYNKPDVAVAYVFPTTNAVEDFSKTRIEPVIQQIPHLKAKYDTPTDRITTPATPFRLPIVQNVRLKRFDTTTLYLRPGSTPKAGEGIPVDVVFFDEIDRMVDNVLIAYRETMSASPIKWERHISTPSLPDTGVDASFQKSDMRYWVMRCPNCGGYFTLLLEWPNCVASAPAGTPPVWQGSVMIPATHVYVHADGPLGKGCGAVIPDIARLMGTWVAARPNKQWHGYQISQLICAWLSATEVIAKQKDYPLTQLFYNYVLGLPYAGENMQLQRKHIEQCIDTNLTDMDAVEINDTAVGTDWGDESWQVSAMPWDNGNKVLLLDLHYITGSPDDNVSEAIRFVRYWNAHTTVNDAGYGKDRNYAMLQVFPSRVWSCNYPNFEKKTVKFVEGFSDNTMTVSVDRTMTLKVMARAFRERRVVIPAWVVNNPRTVPVAGRGEVPIFEAFIAHLCSLASIVDIDDQTGERTERIGHVGDDHFAHAMNYLLIGLRKMVGRNVGDMVW